MPITVRRVVERIGVASAAALVAVLALLVGTTAARAGVPVPPGEEAPPVEEALEGPTAQFDWSVPERYGLGWAAWSEEQARYDTGYVRPTRWPVVIDACSSSGGGAAIIDYSVAIVGVGFDFRTGSHGAGCRYRFENLPRLGNYDVTVTVRTSHGTSAPTTRRIELRDYFVVSLGDSMASGEGVPDSPGLYTFGSSLPATVSTLARIFSGNIRLATEEPAEWQDRRCHRSARAGHALTASALERRDTKSSVTYVSLACSGATIANMIDERYAGIQPPPGGTTLDPQIEALEELVGAGSGSSGRRIDALLMSIGINDLGFSGIVKSCAMNWNTAHGTGDPDCVYDSGASQKLTPGGTMDERYARLGGALRASLDIAEVYITDYPATPFGKSRGGCGLLGIPGFGIASREAEAMYTVGNQLYWAVGRAAASQGWNWVPGMTDAFAGHSYCTDDPYLVHLESSLVQQGTIHGAVHPTRAGHASLANLLLRSIVFRPDLPHWRARLVVEAVRVSADLRSVGAAPEPPVQDPGDTDEPPHDPPADDEWAFDFSVRTVGNWPWGVGHRFTVPKTSTDEWIAVPAELGTFELDVYDPPRAPRHPTFVDFLTYGPHGTLGVGYTFAENFGAGCHELTHGTGWAIRIRIDVTRVGGLPGSPGQLPLPCRTDATE
jgi:hypothetical protein